LEHFTNNMTKIDNLETTLNDFDIEGDGTVDQMSFRTALTSVSVDLSEEQIETAFDDFKDKTGEGIIIADFIQWCRKNLLSAGSSSDGDDKSSLIENLVGPAAASAPAEFSEAEQTEIDRAIVVIKKAMLKKMSKEEVVKFLLGKGMRQDLIDHAYNQAAVDTNPQQKIRHYKELSEAKAQEASNLAYENKKIKRNMEKLQAEMERLRKTLVMSVDMVVTSSTTSSKLDCPADVLEEVNKFQQSTLDENQRDQMKKLKELLTSRRFVVAWLVLQTMDFSSQLPDTHLFLEDFCP